MTNKSRIIGYNVKVYTVDDSQDTTCRSEFMSPQLSLYLMVLHVSILRIYTEFYSVMRNYTRRTYQTHCLRQQLILWYTPMA